jgi:hypothetical protein
MAILSAYVSLFQLRFAAWEMLDVSADWVGPRLPKMSPRKKIRTRCTAASGVFSLQLWLVEGLRNKKPGDELPALKAV